MVISEMTVEDMIFAGNILSGVARTSSVLFLIAFVIGIILFKKNKKYLRNTFILIIISAVVCFLGRIMIPYGGDLGSCMYELNGICYDDTANTLRNLKYTGMGYIVSAISSIIMTVYCIKGLYKYIIKK